jgi:hypothetical protein
LENTIERIELLGEKRSVQRVSLLEPETRDIDFIQGLNADGSAIVLRLPNVPIAGDWKIEFHFVRF